MLSKCAKLNELNTEARKHRVFVFLSTAHRVNFPPVCGEAADSVVSPVISPTESYGTLCLCGFVFNIN